jgi:IS5 family transposase
MRKFVTPEMESGEINIPEIEFDLHSRDEIPKILIGLQHIYSDPERSEQVFDILKDIIPEGTDMNNGRPGMCLWRILVLGVLRLDCNWNYDQLKEMADNHKKIREMSGHAAEDDYTYARQTITDNISLFTVEVLNEISRITVNTAHDVLGKKEGECLKGKCDSFPVETDVCFPTDIRMLFEAVRKAITLIAVLCSVVGFTAWRQHHKNILAVKSLFHAARNLKYFAPKNEKDEKDEKDEKKKKKAAERREAAKNAHRNYIDLAASFMQKVRETMAQLRMAGASGDKLSEIMCFVEHAERQIDQIRRRVLEDEDIPHKEKVFSIFEEHTEWIDKGKAGVSQILGKNVCILRDQYQLILHHRVMDGEADVHVAVPVVGEAGERFPDLNSCSFDKGFWSPENREKLGCILAGVILPKKGKLSLKQKDEESSEDFRKARRQHSAVESSISALRNHGLDRCPDHGLDGFKRYVALAVLARNIQILGHILQQQKLRRQKRRERYNETMEEKKRLAAA